MQKKLLEKIGFSPKENTIGIYHKKYARHADYAIEVSFETEKFYYGSAIKIENEGALHFSGPENWVVLECINRLLEKGYSPQSITLEKTWATGHGTSGRLDILVSQDDGSAYLMIECKTFGSEFDKEFKRLQKDGGQLFTYFQQDKDAEVLMLYASELNQEGLMRYRNEIIKVEEEYRQTTSVKDFYERWNKIPKDNGVFEDWVYPYGFQSKALTPKLLKEIKQEDSSFIFNRFLEILRHHVVSDKPNAFNKIFTLFLCKICDEQDTRPEEELGFQWKEGADDHIIFQKRLTDLYRKGMKKFLEKEVSDLSDAEFEAKFGSLDEKTKNEILDEFTRLRLKKNNEFAIKEVFDDDSFDENAKVIKEVVELLQGYKIRYSERHQYLSDFFELLLTTGLKQESGQFFTPVPVAQFIIKSLPVDQIVRMKLARGEEKDLLPFVIDYAAGSGHFLTESMHEIHRMIMQEDPETHIEKTAIQIKKWKTAHFDWAEDYVYGIEKDYRLVKVGKVSCYLHGDGLAQVIHGDGLGHFRDAKEFKGKLKSKENKQDHQQFDMVISNPPYSVSAFKGMLSHGKESFDLFERLTDQSSEIECLFVERTKQLLKDGGVAGIILPSSILNNAGIYTQTREIILQYFEIIAIAELGSNTFMATGTNTVVLFLKRRNNHTIDNIKLLAGRFFTNHQDVTINQIEKPVSKFVSHVWSGLSYADYLTLVQKQPNQEVQNHETFKEYLKKITAKTEIERLAKILQIEQDKLNYFILAYPQKIVLVKSGEKEIEKQFLGYEFSNRRGSEGIHPVQRAKSIDECTKLYDLERFDNPEKVSTYIYQAFQGKYDSVIASTLEQHITRMDLVDMLSFERVDFEKTISLSLKKKVKIKSKWGFCKLDEVCDFHYGKALPENKRIEGKYPVVGSNGRVGLHNEYFIEGPAIIVGRKGSAGAVLWEEEDCFPIDTTFYVRCKTDKVLPYFMFVLLKTLRLSDLRTGSGVPGLNRHDVYQLKIPLPPKDIQEKIVAEIGVLEEKEGKVKGEIEKLKNSVSAIIEKVRGTETKLQIITTKIGSGATPLGGEGVYKSEGITFIRSQNVYDGYFVENGLAYIDEEQAKKLEGVTVVKNDILFNITGASIARCCVVKDKYLPARVNQHVSIMRTNEKALPKYVQLILVSKEYKDRLLQMGEGATSRQAITKSQLENFKIPVPSISEQQKIVAEIEKIENKVTALENELAEIPAQKELILKKYLE